MSTIPISQIVNVIPSVLSAGGAAIKLLGLILTDNPLVPTGGTLEFTDSLTVSAYFGATSKEANIANIYFLGYTGNTAVPAKIIFAQYNQNQVNAYLKGGKLSITLEELKTISGSLSLVVDGVARNAGSINLSAATSFSSAATIIQNAFAASIPTLASITGSIAPATFSITGLAAGKLLTVTAVSSGTIVSGAVLTGTGIPSGSQIEDQISGTTGGVGVYSISIPTSLPTDIGTITGDYGILTVTAVSSGTIAVGQDIMDIPATIIPGTTITGLGASPGTFNLNFSQTVASENMVTQPRPIAVTYSSNLNAFFIASGLSGSNSTIDFATGTISETLLLTANTGATLSQGANSRSPLEFMDAIVNNNINFATFMLAFDPDSGNGNSNKLQFASWNNDMNSQYMFVCSDTDATAASINPATTSLGYILTQNDSNGIFPIYDPNEDYLNAFVCGTIAAINVDQFNGRITLAFRRQPGLVASVVDITTANNLLANGYNYVGAYANADDSFIMLYNGSVTGGFKWADSYVNNIILNRSIKSTLINLLVNLNSIPYNTDGYNLIAAAIQGPINDARSFGAIRTGIPLSESQKLQVNNAAGRDISGALFSQGYYLQIIPASAVIREARGTPVINLWYTDGGSIQKITMASIVIQ